MAGELVPITMFVCIALLVGLALWLTYRARSDVHTTVRAALDQGRELSPELIDRLMAPRTGKNQDLRRALLWLALAAALALCGVSVTDLAGEAMRGCLAGAAFPLCIGIAYLVLWRFARDER